MKIQLILAALLLTTTGCESQQTSGNPETITESNGRVLHSGPVRAEPSGNAVNNIAQTPPPPALRVPGEDPQSRPKLRIKQDANSIVEKLPGGVTVYKKNVNLSPSKQPVRQETDSVVEKLPGNVTVYKKTSPSLESKSQKP